MRDMHVPNSPNGSVRVFYVFSVFRSRVSICYIYIHTYCVVLHAYIHCWYTYINAIPIHHSRFCNNCSPNTRPYLFVLLLIPTQSYMLYWYVFHSLIWYGFHCIHNSIICSYQFNGRDSLRAYFPLCVFTAMDGR